MNTLHAELQQALTQRHARAMARSLRTIEPNGRLINIQGKTLLNLAGNDYLGLADHPALKRAAHDAIEQFGTGAGASRLVSGTQNIHAQVEADFAKFKHAQAALIYPTGYMANLGVLTTLADEGDLICIDKLTHASLIDAARASNAQVRTYPHLQLSKLERLLERFAQSRIQNATQHVQPAATDLNTGEPATLRLPRCFIVTDGVFSMDGDVADLPTLCKLAQRYDATLIVDEAHGTGVLGELGTGLCEVQGVSDKVDIVISTASKALGGLGGIVTGSRVVIDTLVNESRSFIYTTAVPPAQAAVIGAAIEVVIKQPSLRWNLMERTVRIRMELERMGWQIPPTKLPTPIVPLVVGSAQAALALSEHLFQAGILAVAIRPPTVPPNAARVRLGLRADLTDRDEQMLYDALHRYTGSKHA